MCDGEGGGSGGVARGSRRGSRVGAASRLMAPRTGAYPGTAVVGTVHRQSCRGGGSRRGGGRAWLPRRPRCESRDGGATPACSGGTPTQTGGGSSSQAEAIARVTEKAAGLEASHAARSGARRCARGRAGATSARAKSPATSFRRFCAWMAHKAELRQAEAEKAALAAELQLELRREVQRVEAEKAAQAAELAIAT